MSHHPFRKTQPRRAILDDNPGETGAAAPGVGGYVKHGLVALAMSAMGLAMIASVAPNSATQAAAAPRTSTVSTVTPESSAMINRTERAAGTQAPAPEGTVDAFGRSADNTSRSAVRDEIDRAVTGPDGPIVAEQQAATEAALQRVQEAEAEKRKQEEEALKRQLEEEAKKRQQAEEAAKAATAATTPLARGSYSLGARWGAVGAWSRYHTGQDLSAPVGTPIYAAAPGVVSPSNAGGWAGNHVIIKHSDGSTLYAHMASTAVKPGQEVKAGDLIGYVGMTGRTFGPHLHFEYYPNGANISDPYTTKDPYAWLAAKGVRL